MAIKKQFLSYKREKHTIEITGDPEDVKAPMWADLILSHLSWIAVVIILFIYSKEGIIPIIIQWLKKQIFLILFVAVVDSLYWLLSG